MSESTAQYWRKRSEAVMRQGMASADEVLPQLQRSYQQSLEEVQSQIDKLYANYANQEGLSLADAQAYLTGGQVKQWRYKLSEYVERINENGDKQLLSELNALSSRSRIQRLEQVKTAIRVATSEVASKGEHLVEGLLSDVYSGTYRAIGAEAAKGLGLSLEALNQRYVAQAIAYPWSGASYSQRIWNNADQLAKALQQTVTQGLVQGQDVRQMAASIAKATGTAVSNAQRLVRTEVARCVEQATKDGYVASGIKQYQILVGEAERTCEQCSRIDEDEAHDVDKAVMGVNYPPFHPNCRCTTIPYFSKEQLDQWEKIGSESGDVDQKNIDNSSEDDILIAKESHKAPHPLAHSDKAVIPLEKFTQYALDPEKDANKAKAFKGALGYTKENAQELVTNIRDHLDEYDAVEKGTNEYGSLYEVLMLLQGPNGKTAGVKTGWIIDAATGETRMTSAYVTKKKGEIPHED